MTDITCTCGRPTSGAYLCRHCQETLAWAIPNVAAYYADTETLRTKQTRYSNGAGTRVVGKAQPLPIDGRFADTTSDGNQVRWNVWHDVVTWCRTTMEDQPEHHGPTCHNHCLHVSCSTIRRTRWPARNTIQSMCAYLDRQFTRIVRQQWAPEFYDSITHHENQLRRLIDRPAERWYAGRCSVIEDDNECTTELYAHADRGDIVCPGCAWRHDIGDRRAVLLREAEEYHVTATEAASALIAWTDYDGSENKLRDRIQKWRDRGQLDVQDVTSLNGRDRHLYRLGDVLDLLTGKTRASNPAPEGAAC